MKYLKILILSLLMSLFFCSNAYAQDNIHLISSGYTEEGIYYEVYGSTPNTFLRGALSVTRKITYNGKVNPPSSIYWRENISGVNYAGTLTLIDFMYYADTNQTTATYSGTIK